MNVPLDPRPRSAAVALLMQRALCLWLLATAASALPAHAETVRFGGTGSAIGTVKRLAQAYQKVDPSFQLDVVPNLGSGGGIKAVSSGAIQLGAAGRPLKPDERASGLRAIEYGRTAFVLATTKEGVKSLSMREIADLYAGRQVRWADGQPVRLVLRPASDADTALLGSFAPEVKSALDLALSREGMVLGMTDQEAVDAIERLPGALGTASVALLLSEQRRARPLEIDGVAPTLAHVASGRYPYLKTMFFVVRVDAPPSVMKFIEFVGSPSGQQVLAETGHVVMPVAADRSAAATAPPR